MKRLRYVPYVFALHFAVAVSLANADEQAIPSGHPKEGEVAIDSGANGICDSTAAGDDVQLAPAGGAAQNLFELRCGANGVVDAVAGGDDVQLRAPGTTCGTVDVPVIDTGSNGIAESPVVADDTYFAGMVFGSPPANSACIGTGADAIANTAVILDDVQLIAAGLGNSNQPVVLCGDDLIPSTAANNANPLGDDTQAIAVSVLATCGAANDVVVRSGPTNSIADTRSEGAELVLRYSKVVKITIGAGSSSETRALKLQLYNYEFGTAAPVSRAFSVEADDGNCADGTLRFVDADPSTDALDAVGFVDKDGSARIEMEAIFYADRVRTASTRIPLRCEATVTVKAVDTDPESDDARLKRNNAFTIDFEVYDRNDTP